VNEQKNIPAPSSGLYDKFQVKRYVLLKSIIPPVLCTHTYLPTADAIASVVVSTHIFALHFCIITEEGEEETKKLLRNILK